ncbi:MAG: metallophosphoesterase [Muribaculaceae bacterium]|nr:metallophosphoesterase [Muribaculaceae bacterium]
MGISIPRRTGSDSALMSIMWILYGYFSIYLPKILFLIFDSLASIPVLWTKGRVKFLSWIGGILAIFVFPLMWWGALINRYNIDVVEEEIKIADLPSAFDGYRVLQFSDLHVGSYDKDTTFIKKVVNEINSQKVDAIVFTGDIVNRRTDELIPFIETLSQLRATDGVYSILGNHDYGEYCNWESEKAKSDNLELLHRLQRDMGWQLLLNESKIVYRGNDSIAIIGVENWGEPPFPIYGDLTKSYTSLNDSVTKILLTHNPEHWRKEIKDNADVNIALSLSGHTHAMQLSLCGISPASWRYSTWGGKYEDEKGQTLYVNIGLGTVLIPTRIGATPEITILTLRRSEK